MPKQFCPICKSMVKSQPRYPAYVCETCLVDGVEVEGIMISPSKIDVFSNVSVNCKVNNIDCIAQEARYGGTVVQVYVEIPRKA